MTESDAMGGNITSGTVRWSTTRRNVAISSVIIRAMPTQKNDLTIISTSSDLVHKMVFKVCMYSHVGQPGGL